MLIDLQLHSTYSDGYLTPTELADHMNSKGVKVAALTDHNTVGGLEEFKDVCKEHRIKVITGIELYVKYKNHKLNILWYNFDENNPDLHKILRESHLRRRASARRILEKLIEKGFSIDIEKTLDKYTRYIPINRLLDDFTSVKKNLVRIKRELKIKNPTESEIIKEYFKNKKIGKFQESYLSIERIFDLRKKIGGQIILCHPAKHGYINRERWQEYKKMGVDGVELLSPHHNYGAVMYIQQLAREFDFIETGGSDFHRFEGDRQPIQEAWQYFEIRSRYLRGVKKIIG